MRLAAACLCLSWIVAEAAALPLATDGTSPYVIVLPDEATAPEETAARELQEHIERVTGATLPIRREREVEETAPQILVGRSGRATRCSPTWGPTASASGRRASG